MHAFLILLLRARLGLSEAAALFQEASVDPVTLLFAAQRHRIVSLVGPSGEFDVLHGRYRELFADYARKQSISTMRSASTLDRVVTSITESGVRVLVIKGPAFSQDAFGDWRARGTSRDLDILIPPKDVPQAHAALCRMGYRALDGGRTPPIYGWRGKYGTWLHYERTYASPALTPIDVHWRPAPGSAPWTSFEELWAQRNQVEYLGQSHQTVGRIAALRIASAQGTSDGWPTLRAAADVFVGARNLHPAVLIDLVHHDRLVSHSLHVSLTRLSAAGLPVRGSPGCGPGPTMRAWQLRRGTDNLAMAATRSTLGRLLPARKFMPPVSSTPR